MMINFDPMRLFQGLNNTGLQTKDNALYQVIKQIIEALGRLTGSVNQNTIVIQNTTTSGSTSSATQPPNIRLGDEIFIEETYRISSVSGSSTPTVYDSILTNGDPIAPEILFDSNGDVIVTQVPL
jgi:hypothetical protein